jgi:glycosyltransferase involved in cell wall biosynthesis
MFSMDNPWSGTPKQWLGVASSRYLLKPTYDAVLLCDERQAVFAERLGFPPERMVWGMAVGDRDAFATAVDARGDGLPPRAFIYSGRLSPEKGIDVLAAGYARYRSRVDDPWGLIVVGAGRLATLFAGIDGVDLRGFVQPDALPAVFAEAGCLVLPSHYDHWGVVLHEAAAAGLPIVCTRACGASTRLLLDGYNGAVVSTGDPEALAGGLVRIHDADDDERRAMGVASSSLARQYSPQQWAERILGAIPRLRADAGLPPAPWREDPSPLPLERAL